MKEWGKVYHGNTNLKKIEMAILISHKDFRARTIIRDRETLHNDHYHNINSLKAHNNPKYVHLLKELQTTKIIQIAKT